jgi:hypothetical protein
MALEFGGLFRWPMLFMVAPESHNICCGGTWSSNPSGDGAILAFSNFFNQIFHQKEPEMSVGIFSLT